jgi:copper homeostasis protein CutC
MAGGKIALNNAATILRRTGVTEIHAGLATPVPRPMSHRNSRLSLGKRLGYEYQHTQVLEESVRKLARAISSPVEVKPD